MKTIAGCSLCGDPIYDFQKIGHIGCIEEQDGIWCPRCGKVFHDEDIEGHPEDYYTCPACFAIQHTKCRDNL